MMMQESLGVEELFGKRLIPTDIPVTNKTPSGSQVTTTSSIIETQPGTATNKSVTTCNKDVVTHCEAVVVCPEEEISNKPSLHPSPINSDSDTEDKRELDCNASHVFLENSIPNEFSIPETEKEDSQLDLSHVKFSDLDMEYWSNFSFKDTGIFAEDYFDGYSSHGDENETIKTDRGKENGKFKELPEVEKERADSERKKAVEAVKLLEDEKNMVAEKEKEIGRLKEFVEAEKRRYDSESKKGNEVCKLLGEEKNKVSGKKKMSC
ncbi:uncharacterized protein HKW66_Vig0082790 [Vigna angularis]|uniref:Uncharacterized protein n=1 Tax=Phaseolus angularis TaxID=3914 RepID=A0A8T0KJE5_PHAAN|nr:uncharacterized protein HKW66_Vig0082790 [Vigna angularis]